MRNIAVTLGLITLLSCSFNKHEKKDGVLLEYSGSIDSLLNYTVASISPELIPNIDSVEDGDFFS